MRTVKRSRIRFAPFLFAVCLEIYGIVQWCRDRTAKEVSYRIEVNVPSATKYTNSFILTAAFVNERSYPLVVTRSHEFHSGIFSVKVSNGSGPLQEKSEGPYRVGGNDQQTVEPGKKIVEDINLAKFYDLVPGDYTVAITTNDDVGASDQHFLLAPFMGTDATVQITIFP